MTLSRRAAIATLAVGASAPLASTLARAATRFRGAGFRVGLVTWQWGRDLSLTELIQVCSASGLQELELRTTHDHGVEPSLSDVQRNAIKKQVDDSPVGLIGIGSNERFDSPDDNVRSAAVEATKRFLQLSSDIGGSGVKVKPDRFHNGIKREETIAQIASSLDECGHAAAALGQQIRLEVHGCGAEIAVTRAIMERVNEPAVRICWNSNAKDLASPGFHANFDSLRPFFGDTLHVREFNQGDYPIKTLIERLIATDWQGVVLLEAHSAPGPKDTRTEDLAAQRKRFDIDSRNARERLARTPAASGALEPLHAIAKGDGHLILSGDRTLAGTTRTPRGPVLYPLNAPSGGLVVRGAPIDPQPGDSTDHPHHRSMWVAHGDVNGHDFWHNPESVVQLHDESIVQVDPTTIEVHWKANWRAGETVLLEETRIMRFQATLDRTRIDFDLTLAAIDQDVRFGDTKEGFFALRLAPTLKVDGSPNARGILRNSNGDLNRKAWGKRARFVEAEGPIGGRLVVVRMSDNENNPIQPTWWHARTYGLLAANPFGRKAFEGAIAPSAAIVVAPGDPLHLRYSIEIESS